MAVFNFLVRRLVRLSLYKRRYCNELGTIKAAARVNDFNPGLIGKSGTKVRLRKFVPLSSTFPTESSQTIFLITPCELKFTFEDVKIKFVSRKRLASKK